MTVTQPFVELYETDFNDYTTTNNLVFSITAPLSVVNVTFNGTTRTEFDDQLSFFSNFTFSIVLASVVSPSTAVILPDVSAQTSTMYFNIYQPLALSLSGTLPAGTYVARIHVYNPESGFGVKLIGNMSAVIVRAQ